jgi:hypothetical protein
MSAVVTLKQLNADAKRVTLKVGDRVAFLPMGGIWGELEGLTGIIKKKNKDPMWRYDVEIDLPHLLYPGADHMRKNDFVTCVGPTAIVSLKQLRKETVPRLNRGIGVVSILPKMSKLCALRRLWYGMQAMDEKQVKDCTEYLSKYPSGESTGYFKSQLKHSKAGIEWARKMITEYTEKIEKLKKKGAVEPPCDHMVATRTDS